MKGFTFWYKGNDVFIVSDKTRKSRTMLSEAFKKIGVDATRGMIEVYYDFMKKAECEVKTLPYSGRQYYDIHGKGFGGCGYFLDEGKTMIIKL